MSDLEGNMEDGLAAISEILKVHGRVWPSTSENIQLKAQMDDGSVVIGESAITASPHKIVRLMTEPENPKASQRAVDAILHADAIILGPGSLYTSVLAKPDCTGHPGCGRKEQGRQDLCLQCHDPAR